MFVDEPVATWEQHGLLAAMYENRISRCSFQMMALSTRYANLLHALATDADIIISERSIESDRACFADVNLDTAEDVAAYSASHDALSGALPNDIKRATVFLHAPRSVLMQRIAKRGRECEEKLEKLIAEEEDPVAAGGVPEEYLARLDEAHERLWARTPKDARKWVDATRSEADVAEAVLACIDELCEATLEGPLKPVAKLGSGAASIVQSPTSVIEGTTAMAAADAQ